MLSLIYMFWVLIIFNILASIYQRKKIINGKDNAIHDVPSSLQEDVNKQIEDGYRIVATTKDRVRLVKKKRNLFSWLLVLVLPNVTFNTCVLCNVYGIQLKLNNGEIDLSTF